MKRKGQVPRPEYSPQDVCRIVLDSLSTNDDPQLDHGACVTLEFKSPVGALADANLSPSTFGEFLRREYSNLVDFKEAKLLGGASELGSSSISLKQDVRVFPFGPDAQPEDFSFYLSYVGDLWLIDVILRKGVSREAS